MVKHLNFVKLAGHWFAHLPDYEGEFFDLEMVEGADVLCDMVDYHEKGLIRSTISDEPLEEESMFDSVYTLDFVNSTEDIGANYRCREFKLDLWLCSVTKYVFGKFPETIYVRV